GVNFPAIADAGRGCSLVALMRQCDPGRTYREYRAPRRAGADRPLDDRDRLSAEPGGLCTGGPLRMAPYAEGSRGSARHYARSPESCAAPVARRGDAVVQRTHRHTL